MRELCGACACCVGLAVLLGLIGAHEPARYALGLACICLVHPALVAIFEEPGDD